MAILGFILLVVVALYLIINGIRGMYVWAALTGRMAWSLLIWYVGVGVGILYVAVKYAPLTVSIAGT